ncbi:MAG: glycoside hydrolase family 5 protein [Fibromonadales bacterium]|nr:glycoside hydrolase family 5 protein [Fibromonadales bacterium]
MKKLLLFVFVGLFCFACTSNNNGCAGESCENSGVEPGETPGEEPGGNPGEEPPPPPPPANKLSVNGPNLMKNGEKFVLRGMSLYWYEGPWGGQQPGNSFYTEATVMALANPDTWGANLVRAAIGNVKQDPGVALSVAKNMMDWAKNAGIYVIIDNHSHIAHRPGHAEAANNFFREVSSYAKEKGYTHVIYEIYNEPVCDWDKTETNCTNAERTSWETIKSFSVGVINTIRGNDPDGIILVGTPNFSANIQVAASDPIAGHNLMYVLHYYAGTHMGYQTRFKEAYCANFPIFISEWGTPASSGTGTINVENNNSWMSLVESAGVSWANWSLVTAKETSAALASMDVNGPTTESGTMVKTWIRELNAGRSTSGVVPTGVCN